MLGVFSDSAQNGVDKSLRFAQALAKESLESLPADRDVSFVLYLTLMLLPAEQGGILQEGSCKRNLVWTRGTGGGKVIFALLEEIVTLQASFTPINVWEPSFQRPLTWAFIMRSKGNDRNWNQCRRSKIQNSFEDPLEVILQISNFGGVGRARSSKRSNDRCNNGNKRTCCSGNRGATVLTLGEGFTSKLVFGVVKILAKTVTSGRSSH